ncbi:MAG: GldG family protein [Deltaproteobacteria bacterium]|nr:GldG family protein [Candidatus Zymogenaceae bacterium]
MKKLWSTVLDFFKRIEFEPLTRGQKYGVSTVVAVVLVLAIVVLLEVLSYNHSKQFDLTEDKRYTVSMESTNLMESLTSDLKAVAFFSRDDVKTKVGDLLEQYKYASDGKFEYRFVDLYLSPGDAKTYKVTEDNTIVFIYGDRQERVVLSDTDIVGSGEQKLTNAMLKVTSTEPKTVYFLIRHGERDMDLETEEGFSRIKTRLESQNYVIKALDLLSKPTVPDDAAALIIAAPQKDLFDDEIGAVTEYLNRGGSLLVMLDAGVDTPKLTGMLKRIGIAMPSDVVIDRDSKVLGGDYLLPVASTYLKHPITKDLTVLSFYPYARSVVIDETAAKDSGWSLGYLVNTGTNSWAETDLGALRQGKAEFNKGVDTAGPVAVAVEGSREITSGDEDTAQPKEARIVVFGSSSFVVNTYYLMAESNAANIDIFLNSVNWLAGNENLISIHAKERTSTPLFLTGYQGLLIFLVCVVLVPLAVLGVGIFIYFRRRFVE